MIDSPPVRRPGRPRSEDSGDVEQRLLDAGMRMLLEHGPSLTMNTIIAASGLSRKTVYAHYPNKQALFAAVVRQMLGYARSPLAISPRPQWQQSLLAFVEDCLAETCQPHATVMRRLMMLYPSFMEEVRPQVEQVVVRRYLDPLTSHLQSLVDQGLLPDQDVAFAAGFLTSMILSESQRLFFQSNADAAVDRAQLKEHARQLTALFCGGIERPGRIDP
jgi:AcrR family transcriptional regulator